MATFTVDASLRREFDRRWRDYVARQQAALRGENGVSIIVDPTMHGPDLQGKVTYFDVDSEFASELRNADFGECR